MDKENKNRWEAMAKQIEELRKVLELQKKPGVVYDRKLKRVVASHSYSECISLCGRLNSECKTYKKKLRFVPKWVTELKGIDKVLYGSEG